MATKVESEVHGFPSTQPNTINHATPSPTLISFWNGQIISINMSTIMYKCCILDLVGGITAAISRFTCIARFREDYLPVYKRTGIHP